MITTPFQRSMLSYGSLLTTMKQELEFARSTSGLSKKIILRQEGNFWVGTLYSSMIGNRPGKFSLSIDILIYDLITSYQPLVNSMKSLVLNATLSFGELNCKANALACDRSWAAFLTL